VQTPEYCVLGAGEVAAVNAWLGPPGTVTPLHTDPHNNLLCQVVGAKYVRLYSPAHNEHMYPHQSGLTTNSSRVDARAPDLDAFPKFAQARGLECVLREGMALFIPKGWWHYVEALTLSMSVSFWWS
jgi:[histone H3]-dimethyl/trimethyl-L-lysine36 demethylase